MPIKFKIDFGNIKKKTLKQTVSAVSETTQDVYNDIKLYSPIDTGTYLKWHRNRWITIKGNRVVWIVENLWDYVERVESGFRKNSVNWHLKNLWQIYTSKWADVYWKATAKNKDKFITKLKW